MYLFCVPDDYATGHEADLARRLYPSAHVYDPKSYVRFAFGRDVENAPQGVDVVQYLGGDLMHALRVHGRLGGVAATYKFSKKAYREKFARFFAVDEKNVEQLRGSETPDERIETVGNLAIDGALLEAQQPLEHGVPDGGILVMPGSRGYEVENMIPFFFTMALRISRERPDVRIAFGISPFTSLDDVRRAVEAGGDSPRLRPARAALRRGRLRVSEQSRRKRALSDFAQRARRRDSFTLGRDATGNQVHRTGRLGVPMITTTPLNAAELITFNGPLTYLDRIPYVGTTLKREVAVRVSRRFTFHTQPNIDAGEMVIEELHGTLTPTRCPRGARTVRRPRVARAQPYALVADSTPRTSGPRTEWPNRFLPSVGF